MRNNLNKYKRCASEGNVAEVKRKSDAWRRQTKYGSPIKAYLQKAEAWGLFQQIIWLKKKRLKRRAYPVLHCKPEQSKGRKCKYKGDYGGKLDGRTYKHYIANPTMRTGNRQNWRLTEHAVKLAGGCMLKDMEKGM